MYTGETQIESRPHAYFANYSSPADVPHIRHASNENPRRLSFVNGDEEDNVDFCNEDAKNTSGDDEEMLLAVVDSTNSVGHSSGSLRSLSISNTKEQHVRLSASPAAMFLSAFSSPMQSLVKEDDEGQVVAGYTLGNIIGYGGFSVIRRAFSTSGDVVAVKIIRHSDLIKKGNVPLLRKRMQHESSVWAELSHEHVLPLFSALHTSYADYFITLFCPAGSLFDILKRDGRPALPQDDAGMMFRQVVRGLRYLHEVVMYVHRDIKLENVLVDEMGVCRIGDFGMSRKIGEIDEEDEVEESNDQHFNHDVAQSGNVHRTVSLAAPSTRRQHRASYEPQVTPLRHSSVRHRNSTSSAQPVHPAHIFQPGSLPYAAPELLLPQTSCLLRPHPAQDIWALGILLYALLTGRLPFVDSFEPRLQMKILNGVYDIPTGIGRGAERVLQGCLDRSTATRWSINTVDDVAWGVGWGAEGDHVTPEANSAFQSTPWNRKPSNVQPRSGSRPPLATSPTQDWQQDEPKSRPSYEAASRRSSSRAKRSLSRAFTERTTSQRSISRHSRAESPSFSSLNNSILSVHSPSTPSSPFGDSALLVSPSLDRGRRLSKSAHNSSRSPSPSVVPTTPVDFGPRFDSPMRILADHPDDLGTSRGRSKYGHALRSLRSEGLYTAAGEIAMELDILEETVGWSGPDMKADKLSSSAQGEPLHGKSSRNGGLSGQINDRRAHFQQDIRSRSPYDPSRRPKAQRSGSSPPTSVTSWSSQRGTSASSRKLNQESFLNLFNGTSNSGLRSRSVDERYTLAEKPSLSSRRKPKQPLLIDESVPIFLRPS